MADALDSKSSMGNHVWVQLPPPVLRKALLEKNFRQRLFARLALSFFGSDCFSQDFTRLAPNDGQPSPG